MVSMLLRKGLATITIKYDGLTPSKAFILSKYLGTWVRCCNNGETYIVVEVDEDTIVQGKDWGRVEVTNGGPPDNGFCMDFNRNSIARLSRIREKLNTYLHVFTWVEFGEHEEEPVEPVERKRPGIALPADPVYILVYLSVLAYLYGLEETGKRLYCFADALLSEDKCCEIPGSSIEEMIVFLHDVVGAVYSITKNMKHPGLIYEAIRKVTCDIDPGYIIDFKQLIDIVIDKPYPHEKSLAWYVEEKAGMAVLIRAREHTQKLLYGGGG